MFVNPRKKLLKGYSLVGSAHPTVTASDQYWSEVTANIIFSMLASIYESTRPIARSGIYYLAAGYHRGK